MHPKNRIFLYLVLVIFLSAGCGKKNRFEINTTNNRVEVEIKRFDLDLIRLDTTNLKTSIDTLFLKYPAFLPLFIENMTSSSDENRDSIGQLLNDFLNYPLVQEVNEKVLEKFSDISLLELEISDFYTYLHHYFPNLTLPELYFYVSGLNVPMIMDRGRTMLGVGTDFYLGADFQPYQSLFYDYMLQNRLSERMPIDAASAVVFSNFRYDTPKNRLIDTMLYRGKGLYLLSVMMPKREAFEIVGYNAEQWKWAETHEQETWNTIVGQKELFSSDQHLIRKYMQEAPFTAPISQDAPGRLGEWVGFRIVESFMKKNKNITLPELMQLNDYQELLVKSGYGSKYNR